jgi:protein-tyrosine phosphatase
LKQGLLADVHQHVLWGLDDGSQTEEEMHALLEQDAAEGVGLVFATCHGDPSGEMPDPKLYHKRLKKAKHYCKDQGLDIRVLPGCEIFYRDSAIEHLAAGNLIPLGNSRFVLVEFELETSLKNICNAADRLYRAGYAPIVAHVERYTDLMLHPKQAIKMREEYGLTYQMNCHTITHPRGLRMQYFVHRMLKEQAIDVIASDAHNVTARPVRMQEAKETLLKLTDEEYTNRLLTFGWKLAGEKK